MIPIVEDFVKRFDLDDFVIVADSGLINKTNISLLESGNYKYIIGANIKSETEEIKQWILSLHKTEGSFYGLGKLPKSRLIIGYSGKRVGKDKYNRDKGIKRLKTAYKSGMSTKEHINKRGYNKFFGNIRQCKSYDKSAENQRRRKMGWSERLFDQHSA